MILLMIGTTELLLVAGLALLLFGGKKLPEMMKGMGQGVKSFKEGLNEPLEDTKADNASQETTDSEEEDSSQETNPHPDLQPRQ